MLINLIIFKIIIILKFVSLFCFSFNRYLNCQCIYHPLVMYDNVQRDAQIFSAKNFCHSAITFVKIQLLPFSVCKLARAREPRKRCGGGVASFTPFVHINGKYSRQANLLTE